MFAGTVVSGWKCVGHFKLRVMGDGMEVGIDKVCVYRGVCVCMYVSIHVHT